MPAFPTSLFTKRLHLRRYVQEDAAWYAAMALRNRRHLARFESENAAMKITSETEAAETLCGFQKAAELRKAAFLGAFRQEDGAFVGQIYLGLANANLPAYVIGYFCDEAHLKRGHTVEAAGAAVAALFRDYSAMRVGLWCDDTNLGSQRIAKRLGMSLEGHVRSDKRHADGSVTGSLCYGLLREEFLAQQASNANFSQVALLPG